VTYNSPFTVRFAQSKQSSVFLPSGIRENNDWSGLKILIAASPWSAPNCPSCVYSALPSSVIFLYAEYFQLYYRY